MRIDNLRLRRLYFFIRSSSKFQLTNSMQYCVLTIRFRINGFFNLNGTKLSLMVSHPNSGFEQSDSILDQSVIFLTEKNLIN